jgi:hypothetical protein
MSVLNRLRTTVLVAATVVAGSTAFAADPAPTPASTPSPSPMADRLFLAFAQDAAMVSSQWWEGQVEYAKGSHDIPVNVLLVRGVVAFRPIKSLEVGGRVGFGTTNARGNLPDGSGATDLDAYGKWVFANVSPNLDFSAGILVTVPTGDDTAGLGFNAFSSQAFGGVRYRLEEAVIGGHVGVRFNGDGDFQLRPLSGKTSFELGFSAVFPLAHQVSLIGEAQFETKRFDEIAASSQLLVGADWKAFRRGMFRGAVAAGLTDGAPNLRVLLGYAYSY